MNDELHAAGERVCALLRIARRRGLKAEARGAARALFVEFEAVQEALSSADSDEAATIALARADKVFKAAERTLWAGIDTETKVC